MMNSGTKIGIALVAVILSCGMVMAQKKVLSEAVVTYQVSVVDGGANKALASAFDGAMLRLTIKGYQAKSEFASPMRNQTIIFDAKTKSGVLLRESGSEKYMMTLTPANWTHYNRKYEGIVWRKTSETKLIEGMQAEKVVGKMKDGSEIIVFQAPEMEVLAQGYDGQFSGLDGFPMEYQVTSGGVTVNYKVSVFSMQPVSMSKFDLPTSGYKVLEYKQ